MEFTFSSLGKWRKIYLIYIWLVGAAIALWGCSQYIEILESTGKYPHYIIGIIFLYLSFGAWTHLSTVKRNLKHLFALVVVQIFPLFNPIGAYLTWNIYIVSKEEHAKRENSSITKMDIESAE